jgi:hypothetical protein
VRVLRSAVAWGLCGLVGAVTPTSAAGQDPTPATEAPRADTDRKPPVRDEAFRMADAYIVAHLQERLALTDDQFVKVLPSVKKLNDERRHARVRKMVALRRLQRELERGVATERGLSEGVAAIREAESSLRDAEEKHIAAIDAVLTPVQQAKFRVLEYEIDRRMRSLLERTAREREVRRRDPF